MDTYESTCDQLDHLALRNLRLSNDLIRLKLDLDTRLRDGWLSMAKTRFVYGYHRFGTVNLSDPESIDPSQEDPPPQIVVDLEKSGVKKEMIKFATRIDDFSGEVDQKKAKEEMERRLLKRFGGLTPGTLRQGQKTFETVVELVCEIASVESELSVGMDEFKRLIAVKEKLKREN